VSGVAGDEKPHGIPGDPGCSRDDARGVSDLVDFNHVIHLCLGYLDVQGRVTDEVVRDGDDTFGEICVRMGVSQ